MEVGEKQATAIHGTSPSPSTDDVSSNIVGFETDLDHLPKNYYYSPFFIGSMLATGFSLCCGVGAFGLAAPLLTIINEDLGPDKNFIWVSLIYNVTLSVCLVLVGKLSDVFGRRYFFIGGQLIGVIGCVVCVKSTSVPMLIGKVVTAFSKSQVLTEYRWQFTTGNCDCSATKLPFRHGRIGTNET
jgi:hypothetical protein